VKPPAMREKRRTCSTVWSSMRLSGRSALEE